MPGSENSTAWQQLEIVEFLLPGMPTIQVITLTVLGVLLIAIAVLSFAVYSLWKRLEALFRGKRAKDLEELFRAQSEEVKKLDHDVAELYEVTNRLLAVTRKGVQKIGVVRFNPFPDIGGDQSFVICFLDADNSGLLLSSLHTREGTRVYAKPVSEGTSPYPLSPEEEAALRQAMDETPRRTQDIKHGTKSRGSKNKSS